MFGHGILFDYIRLLNAASFFQYISGKILCAKMSIYGNIEMQQLLS